MRQWLAAYGATFVVFPLAWLARTQLELDDAELLFGGAAFYAAHVLNDPHFAVTYLLFYRDLRARLWGGAGDDAWDRAQRVRFAIAGFVVPLALVAWAVFALASRSAQMIGWMAQLMLLLVGWHYAKQGFGMLNVLSRRKGARWSPRERSVLLAHCYAAWAFSWANPARAASTVEEKGVVYWAPPHPRALEVFTFAVFAASTLALVSCLVLKWRRERSLPLGPVVGFLVTIWLWTVFTSLDPLVRYVIPALHSLQYLYFVALMKGNQARAEEAPPRFGRPTAARLGALALGALTLGFLLFDAAPELLDLAQLGRGHAALGATPCFAALFVVVNVHHYFMDAVIWRRDNPETAYLYATEHELR